MTETTQYGLFIVYADGDAEWVEGFLKPSLEVPFDRIITTVVDFLEDFPDIEQQEEYI